MNEEALSEGLAHAGGYVIAELRREWRRELELQEAESRAIIANLRAEIMSLRAAMEQDVRARLSMLKDGLPGPPGPPGPQGEKGDCGPAGLDGAAGASGPAGPMGPSGEIGAAGEVGADGPAGDPGLPGPQGQQGEIGPQGPRGYVGPQGERGPRGEKGEPGDSIVGPRGEKGARGERGEKGERGPEGIPGLSVKGEQGERGPNGERGYVGPQGEVGPVGPQGPSGDDGRDGERGENGAQGERGERGEQGERGERGAPGLLPMVKHWREGEIAYEGEIIIHEGSTWQATKDTAQAPGGDAWALVAAAGNPGRGMKMRGTYDEKETYHALDVVTRDYGWFAARKDDPGPCPGPGWQSGPVGKRGDKGLHGERGPQGPQGQAGKDAREWVAVKIDRASYAITPIMSDGSEGPSFSVRELFDQYHLERRGA